MRLLLDENVEHEVHHRLRNYGHDVTHVDFDDGLRKGDSDDDLAAFSLAETRVVVTYDDDFREFDPESYHAVLFLADQSLSAREVADAVHEVSTYYDTDDLEGFQTVGRSWLP